MSGLPTTRALVEIDGVALDDDLAASLEVVTVDDDLVLADMFQLCFRDPERSVLGRARISIGSGVRIKASPHDGGPPALLLAGEVTALEADLEAGLSRTIVRGYDQSHRLHRARHTATYRNATDADVATKIARRAGVVPGRIDGTRIVHDHLAQVNQTDWEFLRARAQELGFEVAVRDGRLDFCAPRPAASGPDQGDFHARTSRQLVVGANLESFRPRITANEQVADVEVRGWDAGQKQVVVGTARTATESAVLTVTPSQLAEVFSGGTRVGVDRPFTSQIEVDTAARALAEHMASTFAEAEGTALGHPELTAGTSVSISLAGAPFDGRYMLSSTRHVFDRHGYRTHFVVAGRQERSLLGLTSLGATNGAPGQASTAASAGVAIAIVTDVADPTGQGRVRVRLPWLAEGYESDWARVVHAGAGAGRGWVVVPEVNDEVLVAFDHGDTRRPYVLGGLYNGVDRHGLQGDPVDAGSGSISRRGLVTRVGHRIEFVEDGSDGGAKLATRDDGVVVQLVAAGTTLRLRANGDITIEAKGGNVAVKAAAQLTLEAGADLSIKSGGAVSISGTVIRLN